MVDVTVVGTVVGASIGAVVTVGGGLFGEASELLHAARKNIKKARAMTLSLDPEE